ncbi:MAG: histidine--tRNA ligase [archaeon]|nr:histidine--tRNA ligase [archaeon]MCR4323486.1 histidine--tRNA ligase [Nanoarchaeota archaeon]
MNTNTIKGFRDFIGEEALKRAKIRSIIEDSFKLYGFEPAETPVIESEEFVRGENTNDEAVSSIFKLEDRGKRKLALRYEFTFQLKRIAQNQKLPYKRYQMGPVFRDEPVSTNRFRQFTQCDADVIGSSQKDEAEIFSLIKNIFDKLGIKPVIYFNNRRLLNEIMVSENIEERKREQVIKELDKLDKLPKKEVADNLKNLGAERILKVFDQGEKAFEKYNFYKEIKELKKRCNDYGIKIEFSPTLARGLSYYNGTILEVRTKEMKETICAGGAYLTGNVQSFGFAFGLDRMAVLSNIQGDSTKVQIISIDQDAEAIRLTKNLREKNISVNLILDKTIGKAMEYANSKKIPYVIIIGADEVKKNKIKLKDMKTGKEELVNEKTVLSNLG